MIRALTLLLGFALPTIVSAATFECVGAVQAGSDPALISQIEKRYQAIVDIQASFVQQSLFVGLDKREVSKGDVAFKKPGRMDWIYRDPEEQRFIADGKTVWFFQPSLNQVTIDNFHESFNSELPVTFLLGLGKLSDSFVLSKHCKAPEGTLLELEPIKGDSSLQKFSLLVSDRDYSPVGARVIDIGGNETTIVLIDAKFNSSPADTRFTFQVPRGVDVIDQRSETSTPTANLGQSIADPIETDQSAADAFRARQKARAESSKIERPIANPNKKQGK